MIWNIVSIPLWLFGILLFSMGAMGVWKVGHNSSDTPAFKSGDDGQVAVFSLLLILVSAIPLYAAARLCA